MTKPASIHETESNDMTIQEGTSIVYETPDNSVPAVRPCRLLLLPPELRLTIFEFALHCSKRSVNIDLSANKLVEHRDSGGNEPVESTTRDNVAHTTALTTIGCATIACDTASEPRKPKPKPSRPRPKETAFALTQTCKQIRGECEDLIYKLNNIGFFVHANSLPYNSKQSRINIQRVLDRQLRTGTLRKVTINLGTMRYHPRPTGGSRDFIDAWPRLEEVMRKLYKTGLEMSVAMNLIRLPDSDMPTSLRPSRPKSDDDQEYIANISLKHYDAAVVDIDRYTLRSTNPLRPVLFSQHMKQIILRTFFPLQYAGMRH